MSKSKSKTDLLTLGDRKEQSILKPLGNTLHASNALNLKPLPSLKPLKKNKLPSKYAITDNLIPDNQVGGGTVLATIDPFQKKKLL